MAPCPGASATAAAAEDEESRVLVLRGHWPADGRRAGVARHEGQRAAGHDAAQVGPLLRGAAAGRRGGLCRLRC